MGPTAHVVLYSTQRTSNSNEEDARIIGLLGSGFSLNSFPMLVLEQNRGNCGANRRVSKTIIIACCFERGRRCSVSEAFYNTTGTRGRNLFV